MDPSEESAIQAAWLGVVAEKLSIEAPSDADVRLLLRVTKITADVTGVRFLAPVTAYMIGMAAGDGDGFDLRATVNAISETAEGWSPPATEQAPPGG